MKLRLILLAAGMFLSVSALGANPQVKMRTSLGEIVLELYPDKAPKTVANFLQYVSNGHYNGTLFHRSIQKFVIQGGGFTPDFQYKPTLAPVPNEAANGLKNEPGTLSMARAYDPDSATAQFFINLDDNKFLNHHRPHPDYYGYCVFGKVVKGMDIAKKIGSLPTAAGGPFAADVPVEPVVIEEMALATEPLKEITKVAEVAKPVKSHKKTPKRKKENTHG
ncbi:MAG: peptidylprolyl isomerase [Betaproteobacteria bacterium CG2_30_59_46]|nr:MAG: peptidylprolyl isomerase [Betaproteobacteria bacterium CG2_30_59_46]PIQ13321.1 MAG: peptidylprolyl isomerase [Hydrogenophilales bacterium CG18_big_fil_WC_8_21_14_2_50_58_12]PIY00171.1 MAG: peptidylprolyl isomerase [Hydrogenophilales bacterium CG_4_10_14_3_um_filter_58_23]PJB07132.1 MAG: peptidylprolyl isomerase [Hydrogenophilales bacterium CG_4_9_14_3_um_filter_59_35]